jgi:carboxymethylenebutenolidase
MAEADAAGAGQAVEIEMPDGVADAYLAQPAEGARQPPVLMVPDAFGLRPQIELMADRVAAQGFTVLAPNVFYRAGRAPVASLEGLDDPERRGEVLRRVMPLVRQLTPERIVRDGAAYLERLEHDDRGPVAVVGYCMGGRVGWRIAAAYPDRVTVLAGFHVGGLVTDDEESPHRSAERLRAELYLGFADNDRSMTRDQIATLEQALAEAEVPHRSEVYEGARHGYTMADTAEYDEAAAERHFRELFSLLERC